MITEVYNLTTGRIVLETRNDEFHPSVGDVIFIENNVYKVEKILHLWSRTKQGLEYFRMVVHVRECRTI